MNIHEYQAKDLFKEFGIPAPKGYWAKSPEEFDDALEHFEAGPVVVKSQIHAGGRGKGQFVDGFEGGVRISKNRMDARQLARNMLGNTLVTHQTGPRGRKVQTIYFSEPVSIKKEYYLAILVDRASSCPVIIASTEGGVEIEKVAEETPEKIVRVTIDPALGIKTYQAREVGFSLGFNAELTKQMVKLLKGLYQLFWEKDASMVEINPLITTGDGQLLALDAKVSFDDNALYRQPEIKELRDLNEEDEREIEASKHGLNYIALDGNIACLVNGAGLAMATMDIIKHFGGEPANFLDVGGGANEEQVTAAFEIILSDKNVHGILVNIFGGIMQCDIIAKGIIAAAKKVSLSVPLVVRLEGTNVKEGRELLDGSDLALETAASLSEAARKIVSLAEKK